MDERFDFTTPGYYEIEIQLTKQAYTDTGQLLDYQRVFDSRFEITPRDESALRTTCDSLIKEIEVSSSYEAAAVAAQELSSIRDPVAVPFLRKALLAKQLVEPFAIQGLERIADQDAIRALGEGLGISYHNTSALSRSALLRIETQTSDPEIKQEIRRALEAAAHSAQS